MSVGRQAHRKARGADMPHVWDLPHLQRCPFTLNHKKPVPKCPGGLPAHQRSLFHYGRRFISTHIDKRLRVQRVGLPTLKLATRSTLAPGRALAPPSAWSRSSAAPPACCSASRAASSPDAARPVARTVGDAGGAASRRRGVGAPGPPARCPVDAAAVEVAS
jgi:hypothetical protein